MFKNVVIKKNLAYIFFYLEGVHIRERGRRQRRGEQPQRRQGPKEQSTEANFMILF